MALTGGLPWSPAHSQLAPGKEYLDFTAGIAVNALGHSDAGWQAAVTEAAGQLCHVSNLYLTEPGATLAKSLVEATPFADRAFFCNSGTEANEAAIKFARKYQVRGAPDGGGAGVVRWLTCALARSN